MDRLVMFQQQQEQTILPKIRNDLKVIETSAAEDGSKRWLLFDPIQNKYFNIAVDAFELWNEVEVSDEVAMETYEVLKNEIKKV